MRIVLIGCFALSPKGTVSQRALPLGRALARHGHEVTLLVPPYDNPLEAGRSYDDQGVKVEFLATGGGLLAMTKQLVTMARDLKPDVVHGFKPVGPSGLAALALRLWVPVVQDCDDLEGLGGWATHGGYSWFQAGLLEVQERAGPCFTRQVTVASRALALRLRLRRIPANRIVYLPNCYANDSDESDASAGGSTTPAVERLVDAGEPIVLFVGHVPVENDLDLAVTALAGLAEGGASFQWAIVGDGPGVAGLEAALPTSLRNRTVFAGRLPRRELRKVFEVSRLMLVPVRDTPINRAKCAMKVVDSLAAGLPVVTADVGQNREYVAPGCGILTSPGDKAAMAAAVGRLINCPAEAERLGRNARKRMLGGYTWDHWVGRAELAYRRAVGR